VVGRAAIALSLGSIGLMACGSDATDDDRVLPDPVAPCGAGYVTREEGCGAVGMTADACPAGFVFAEGTCLPDVDLNAETLVGVASALTDVGGNTCGCDGAVACKVLSSMLAPPDVL
jgi:hypothetical protein